MSHPIPGHDYSESEGMSEPDLKAIEESRHDFEIENKKKHKKRAINRVLGKEVSRPMKFKRSHGIESALGKFLKEAQTPSESAQHKSELRHFKKQLKREK